MLRLLVLLLILLNAGYFAWSQGMLRPYGWAPPEQSEPQRLQQQIRPEAIRILGTDEARRAEQAALAPPKPPECLQAGLFDDAQAEAVRQAAEAALPAGAWAMETVTEPARWIVYMGKFPNATALARKRSELLKMNLKLQPLNNPALEPGLSLGLYDSEDRANAELAALQKRGVRTARVLPERPEVRHTLLRIPAVDEAVRARLEELRPALGDKPLRSCAK